MRQDESELRPRRTAVSVAVLAFLLLGGCGRHRGPPAGPRPAPEVAFVTVRPRRVELTTELPGRTTPRLVSDVMPRVNGLILERLFEEGSDVKAGEVLYRIDPAPFQAAYDGAVANLEAAKKAAERARAALVAARAGVERRKAALALAELDRRRFEDLAKDRAVSASARDRAVTEAEVAKAALRAAQAEVESDRAAIAAAEAAIRQAEAAVRSRRIDLGYTKVVAPISGRIGPSFVTGGAFVAAYRTVLATIQQLDPIYVDVPRSTAELGRLRRRLESSRSPPGGAEGKKVEIILEGGVPYPREGTIEFGDVTVDPTTGSVILRILVPNPEGVLLPGMFVRVRVRDGVDERGILIPQQAVSRDPKGRPLVWLVDEEGRVEPRRIETDRAVGDRWLVSSGLAPGDRVIVEGLQWVRPGMPVRAVPWQAGRGSGGGPAKPARRKTPGK